MYTVWVFVCIAEWGLLWFLLAALSSYCVINRMNLIQFLVILLCMVNCGSRMVATFFIAESESSVCMRIVCWDYIFECTVTVRNLMLPQNPGKNVIVMQNWSCVIFWGDTTLDSNCIFRMIKFHVFFFGILL